MEELFDCGSHIVGAKTAPLDRTQFTVPDAGFEALVTTAPYGPGYCKFRPAPLGDQMRSKEECSLIEHCRWKGINLPGGGECSPLPCKICKEGKACGDACIEKADTCSMPIGCAANEDFSVTLPVYDAAVAQTQLASTDAPVAAVIALPTPPAYEIATCQECVAAMRSWQASQCNPTSQCAIADVGCITTVAACPTPAIPETDAPTKVDLAAIGTIVQDSTITTFAATPCVATVQPGNHVLSTTGYQKVSWSGKDFDSITYKDCSEVKLHDDDYEIWTQDKVLTGSGEFKTSWDLHDDLIFIELAAHVPNTPICRVTVNGQHVHETTGTKSVSWKDKDFSDIMYENCAEVTLHDNDFKIWKQDLKLFGTGSYKVAGFHDLKDDIVSITMVAQKLATTATSSDEASSLFSPTSGYTEFVEV